MWRIGYYNSQDRIMTVSALDIAFLWFKLLGLATR